MAVYRDELVKTYASNLEVHFENVITISSYECILTDDSGTEMKVTCVLDEDEKIKQSLEQCLHLVDENKVFSDYIEKLLRRGIIELPKIIYRADFRRSIWKNSLWVDAVVKEIFSIRESRGSLGDLHEAV